MNQQKKQEQSSHKEWHGKGAGVGEAGPQVYERIDQAQKQEQAGSVSGTPVFQYAKGQKYSKVHAQGVQNLKEYHEPGIGKPESGTDGKNPVTDQGEGDVIGIDSVIAFHYGT